MKNTYRIANMSFSSDSPDGFNYGAKDALQLNHQPCTGHVNVHEDGRIEASACLIRCATGSEAQQALSGFIHAMARHGNFAYKGEVGEHCLERDFNVSKEDCRVEDGGSDWKCFIIKQNNPSTDKLMMFKFHAFVWK